MEDSSPEEFSREKRRHRVTPLSRARAMEPSTVAGDVASTSSAGQKRKEPEAPSTREALAYEGSTTRVVRRRKNDDADEDLDLPVEEVVQMISVREGDELLSLGATGEEEWVRVHKKRVISSTPVVTCSTRYLEDAANFELGGYAVSANGAGVLCSLPPPYVCQNTRDDREKRETYTDEQTGKQVDICGAMEGHYCNSDGAQKYLKQGFHVAALSATHQEWKARIQQVIDRELGPGFEVSSKTQKIQIRNTRTGDVQVLSARRGLDSTVEFAGLRFYRADGGDGEVPIYSMDLATYELYRQLEDEKYVSFTLKDPIELVQADEERKKAMKEDADAYVTGTVEFLGQDLLLGLPIGARREPVQLNEKQTPKEYELQCLRYYLLGFWYGDGCVSSYRNDPSARVCIGVGQDEDVERFIAQANRGETCVPPNGNGTDLAFFLDKLGPLKATGYVQEYSVSSDSRKRTEEPSNCITLRILSRRFTEWLRSLGVICRKGDGQYEDLVKEILQLPKCVRKSFVAGCIDSDGSKLNIMSKETLVFGQAVEGGIDQSRTPNAAFNHDKIFAAFGVVASSIPMDVRYKISRKKFAKIEKLGKVGKAGRVFDGRRSNAGEAYIRSPDEVLPSSMPRKTNKRFPGKFLRLGSTFGVWRDPKRSAECVELTVDGATGHLLLANGTVVAVNRYAADDASKSEKID